MIGKSIFQVKFMMSLLMAVLFAAALVAAGCSSSEKKEEPEVTESVEVQEAPQQEEQPEAAPTPAPERSAKRPSGPPQIVLDACVGLSDGDDCTIKVSQGDVAGTCKTISSGDVACMPNPREGGAYQKKPSEGTWQKDGGEEGE